MVKDRLLLNDVVDSVPATWLRNTFSGTLRGKNSRIPTQLVYPNGSFNVGVNVECVRLNHQCASNRHGEPSSEDAQHYPVIVYTSPKAENRDNTLKAHIPLVFACIVYLVLVVSLGPRALNHPDATTKSTKFMWICWCSLADIFVLMFILRTRGYHDLMRLNTKLLVGALVGLSLHIESIFSLVLFAVHCIMAIVASYCQGRCTGKVFIISET